MAAGEPGQRIGRRRPLFDAWCRVFSQPDDHAGDAAVGVAMRSRAEDRRPRVWLCLIIDDLVVLDGFTGQGTALHLVERLKAGPAKLVVPPAGEGQAREPERADPPLACRYIAEIPVEQRHGGRDLANGADRPAIE